MFAAFSPSAGKVAPTRGLDPRAGGRSVQACVRAGERLADRTPLSRLSSNQALLQRKLSIGRTDDPLEHEADLAADRVMRMEDAPQSQSQKITPRVQRKCAACEDEDRELQRSAESAGIEAEPGRVPGSVLETVGSGGEPLASGTRAFFEPRFGYDFSGVRVHRDAAAGESARAVRAQAYTVGHHIVFAPGRHAPHTEEGGRLLAHELAHVVQQGRGARRVQRSPATAAPARPAARDSAAPAGDSAALGIDAAAPGGKGWTAVNDLGIVAREDGANVHESPNGRVSSLLPLNTKVFILSAEGGEHGWYAVTAMRAGIEFGYLAQDRIKRNLPDPEAELHRVEPGETVLGLAGRHYAGKGFDIAGKDKRYLVNALVWVNAHTGHSQGSRPSIYKAELDLPGVKIPAGDDRSPWQTARLEAGLWVWLPGAEYLNSIYEQVVQAAGSTGSIHKDLWRSVKKLGHYAAYALAFAGGLVHGFLKSLYDAVAGIASLVWNVLKSVFTASVVSDVTELADKVGDLTWAQVKDAVGEWAAEWADKLDSDSGWVAGHAHGYLTGYVMAEAAMLLMTGGVLTEIKGAVWSSKLGLYIKDTATFAKLAEGAAKVGEVGEKAAEVAAKVKAALKGSRAGRAVLAAGRIIEWTASGVAKVLALPTEIAQYLTEAAIQGLRRLFALKPELIERIEQLTAAAKRWLFGCHSPCDVDLEAIAARMERTNAQVEADAAAAQQAARPVRDPADPVPAKQKPAKGGVEVGGKRLSRDQVRRLTDIRDELSKFNLHWEDIGLGSEEDVNLLFSRNENIDETIRLLERRARAKIGVRAVQSQAQRPELDLTRKGKGTDPLRSERRPDVAEGQRMPRGTEKADAAQYGGFWGGERGNSEWFSDVPELNQVTHGQPIRFKDGYPDFKPWAREHVRMTITGINDKDFALADRILAEQRGFRNQTSYAEYRKQQGLTWHHVEGSNEMILVPTPLHENVPHVGGASEARAAAAVAP